MEVKDKNQSITIGLQDLLRLFLTKSDFSEVSVSFSSHKCENDTDTDKDSGLWAHISRAIASRIGINCTLIVISNCYHNYIRDYNSKRYKTDSSDQQIKLSSVAGMFEHVEVITKLFNVRSYSRKHTTSTDANDLNPQNPVVTVSEVKSWFELLQLTIVVWTNSTTAQSGESDCNPDKSRFNPSEKISTCWKLCVFLLAHGLFNDIKQASRERILDSSGNNCIPVDDLYRFGSPLLSNELVSQNNTNSLYYFTQLVASAGDNTSNMNHSATAEQIVLSIPHTLAEELMRYVLTAIKEVQFFRLVLTST